MTAQSPVHAGLAAFHTSKGWRGVLVRGPSGAGKSDLTLRLIALGWRLVADDRVLIWRSGDGVWGKAAPPLDGLLEVRSVGVTAIQARPFVEVRLVVDCASADAPLDRVPLPEAVDLCGRRVRRLAINPFEISAAYKIEAYCVSVRL